MTLTILRRVGLLGAAVTFALASGPTRSETAEITTVEIVIKHSRFTPSTLNVELGSQMKFVIVNRDPIDHELIIGDLGVQQRHEEGSEPAHGDIPGEVTVPAGETRQTTYFFPHPVPHPGQLLFGCHYPGHYAYGMRGVILVA